MNWTRSLIKPAIRDIGDFDVRRLLPAAVQRSVGPFVFWDHFGPVTLPAGQNMDVRPHPHIGVGPALDDLDVQLAQVPQLAQLKTLPDRNLTGLADQVITATLKSNLYGTERLWARHGATPVFEASHLLGAIYWTLVDQLALDQVFRCEECGRRFPNSRKRRFYPHFPKHANSPCAVRAAQRRFRRRSGRSRSPR